MEPGFFSILLLSKISQVFRADRNSCNYDWEPFALFREVDPIAMKALAHLISQSNSLRSRNQKADSTSFESPSIQIDTQRKDNQIIFIVWCLLRWPIIVVHHTIFYSRVNQLNSNSWVTFAERSWSFERWCWCKRKWLIKFLLRTRFLAQTMI